MRSADFSKTVGGSFPGKKNAKKKEVVGKKSCRSLFLVQSLDPVGVVSPKKMVVQVHG